MHSDEVALSSSERSAIEIIRNILSENGLPSDGLATHRTKQYLTIGYGRNYPFCNLKLFGQSFYIGLCCDRDTIATSKLPVTDVNKKFARFLITSPADIKQCSESVVSAFRFMNPDYRIHDYMQFNELPELVAQFFSTMETTSRRKEYNLSMEEILFFKSYIESLEANGLRWGNIQPDLMSDGSIRVRGGRIKLQGKKTYMIFTKPGKILATTVENLPLQEYIELQKYWILDCIDNRAIYAL